MIGLEIGLLFRSFEFEVGDLKISGPIFLPSERIIFFAGEKYANI